MSFKPIVGVDVENTSNVTPNEKNNGSKKIDVKTNTTFQSAMGTLITLGLLLGGGALSIYLTMGFNSFPHWVMNGNINVLKSLALITAPVVGGVIALATAWGVSPRVVSAVKSKLPKSKLQQPENSEPKNDFTKVPKAKEKNVPFYKV